MKYIVAVSALMLCTMIGYNMARDLSVRVEELSSIVYFFRFCENQLTYFQSSVVNIIKDFSKEHASKPLNFLRYCAELCENEDFPTAWNKAVSNGDICFNDGKEILIDFGNKIGTSDLETQIKYIDYYILTFEEYLKNAKNDENSNKNLYMISGVTVGLVVAIMII